MKFYSLPYFPYKSDKPNKKFFIITKTGKRVYFGDSHYEDFTQHRSIRRKMLYIQRHRKNEDWTNPDTPAYWSRWLLWEKPTLEEAYLNILKHNTF